MFAADAIHKALRARDLNMLFVAGPGHGGPAVVANAWLEGTYSDKSGSEGGSHDEATTMPLGFGGHLPQFSSSPAGGWTEPGWLASEVIWLLSSAF